MTMTDITDLEISTSKVALLRAAGYETIDDLTDATVDDLAEIVGPKLALKIKYEISRRNERQTTTTPQDSIVEGLCCLFDDQCVHRKENETMTTVPTTEAQPNTDKLTSEALFDLLLMRMKLGGDSVKIHPTGSRASGLHNADSDYDFFTRDTASTEYYIKSCGWKLVTPDRYTNDPTIVRLYQKGNVQLQLIPDRHYQRKIAVNNLVCLYAEQFYKMDKDARRVIWQAMMTKE